MKEQGERRPILYNGQVYGKPITKNSGGGEKKMRLTYQEARDSFLIDISESKKTLQDLPQRLRLSNEIVLRLHPEFSAKSIKLASIGDV